MIKRIIFCLTIIFPSMTGMAQNYHPPYEDEYLGWIRIYNYKGATKPLQVEEKTYSIAQLSIIDSFANWMQASYMPKGGLGDIKKFVTPKKDLYSERYNEGVPPSYGANAITYGFLKKVNGKWTPESNLGFYWTIAANDIPMDYRLKDINTNKICLFTIPAYDDAYIREQPNSEKAKEKRRWDLSGYPAISKYIFFTKPAFNNQELARNVVILSKNNRFPFVQVTIGEMLKYMEESLPVKYAEEKTTVQEQKSYDANQLALGMKSLDTRFENARATLTKLKEKYKNKLKDPAYGQFFSIVNLSNGQDVFAPYGDNNKPDLTSPVYRVDPALEALCKTDKPQWITIKWTGGEMDQTSFKHLHESIVNNFDFDYVYNFFFDPEKVKGKTYQPRRSPKFAEEVKTAEKSPQAQKMESDASVFYFEDFSTTVAGQKPAGWRSEMNADAKMATVVVVNDRKEKWLEIKGQNFVVPQNLKKPLPQDFELSFDLAAPKGIPWGTKSLEFYMGSNSAFKENGPSLQLRIRPGFDGRPGEGVITGIFGNEYFNTSANFIAAGFSNDQVFNTIKVVYRKTGESFEFLINDTMIKKEKKAFPAGTLFNWVQFRHMSSDLENQKYLISNVKVVKL